MTSLDFPSASRQQNGRALFKQALQALLKDPKILGIPLVGTLIDLVFIAVAGVLWILLIPVMVQSNATQSVDVILGVLLAVAFALTHVFSQALVIASANERFEGRVPNLANAFSTVRGHLGALTLFGLLQASIGLVLKYIAENLKGVGSIIRFFGGLAWSVASYFAIPAILFENLGPIASISQSSRIIQQKWGSALRTNATASGLFVLAWLVSFGSFIGGIAIAFNSFDSNSTFSGYLGLGLTGVGALALFASALFTSTVMSYVRVALYRYARGESLPDFNSELLAKGFSATAKPTI